MKIDRQIEYEIRKYISNLNHNAIKNELDKMLNKELKDFNRYELLCYSLISKENEFILGSIRSDSMNQNAGSLRVTLEWFIKEILNDDIKEIEFNYKFDKYNCYNIGNTM